MLSDKHKYRIACISAPEALSEAVHLTAFLSFSRVARLVAAVGVALKHYSCFGSDIR